MCVPVEANKIESIGLDWSFNKKPRAWTSIAHQPQLSYRPILSVYVFLQGSPYQDLSHWVSEKEKYDCRFSVQAIFRNRNEQMRTVYLMTGDPKNRVSHEVIDMSVWGLILHSHSNECKLIIKLLSRFMIGASRCTNTVVDFPCCLAPLHQQFKWVDPHGGTGADFECEFESTVKKPRWKRSNVV